MENINKSPQEYCDNHFLDKIGEHMINDYINMFQTEENDNSKDEKKENIDYYEDLSRIEGNTFGHNLME
ncbi:hypothetical protein [Sporosalibacterium faouarense]|uniref:hypothetical protein n=1 Tax=Sporosalibacterium faouarense TaxID=516123 RepID=UPI00141D6CE8|nr:hypothetical protein [Sporosalibacterium faouarense]MTI49082.1 hypothetical protein [Bacillota bacterium]